ncbi:MAG: 5'-methylthioadenosine/S-adenosylhomocysteine nucleosidase [Chlorobiales bacterium]|nr:5'-methylthioadenosine/S-adenosylhomocysteine nucleosidase [Chlorobiales bacterium]
MTFELDFRQIDFGFSPAVRDGVIDILRDTTRYPFGGVPCFTQTQLPTRPGLTVTTRFKGVDLPGVQAKLTEPFIALYTQRELPARQLVKKYGVHAFELPEYRDLINRLNQGISLPELRESLSCLGDMRSARLFVSMFMDDAVDRGIAVPITVDDGTYVYRAFRHGEDVKFTEIEARLVCLMLQEVGRAMSLASFPRLVVEKLIVLLIKGGLSRGFIERWTGSLGDRKAAGIRFYLQGAVAQLSPDRRPYHYSPSDSLTSLLKGWGYLTESTKGGQYQVGQFPERPPTTTATEKDARALGATIGLALSGTSAKQRDDELTLISTCLSPMDTIAALAAELHYFESHWEPLARALFDNAILPNADEIVRGHGVYEAVNSGLWKWRSYGDGAPTKMLRAWHDRLAKLPTAVLSDAVLEGAFPVSDSSFCFSEINGLIDLAGRWLLEVNIALRRLRVELISASPNAALKTTQRSIADLKIQIQRLKHEAGFVETHAPLMQGSQLDLPFPIVSIDRQGELTGVLEELGILIIEARAILDQVDALVTPFGQPRALHYYRHLMTIHLGDCYGRNQIVDDRIATAVRKLTIEASKSSSSAELFPLTNANDLWAADFAVASTGLFGREWLSRIAHEVFSVISGHAKCRICLWPDLEPDEQIVRGENTSDALARNLQCRVHSLVATLALRPSRDELIVLSSHGVEAVAAVRNELIRHMGDSIHLATSPQEILLTEPRNRTYTMETLEKLSPGQKRKPQADIGIITVVPEEMNAAIVMLQQSEKYAKDRKDGAVYYMASMAADEGGQHFVVATQQLEQGNRSVILAYDRLCREYQPSIVILLGIGGSIDSDIELCDVVIADQVIWYEQATVTDTGVNRKGESSKLSAGLRILLNDFFAQKGYPFQLSNTEYDKLSPRAYLGPIGTGEKVVRFREDEIRKWLIGFNYKCMALETEAGGLAQAFYETSITTSYLAKGYMVIRGISDHADRDKDDKWRKIAAHNACTFLKEFLTTVPPIGDYLTQQSPER